MQKPGLFGMNGFIVFLLSFFSFIAKAQQGGYIILIDAENKQAFTIRLGDQFYTSSSHGHLVLPHLKDSNYRLSLRFPKMNQGELVFPVTVHQKDLGFQLKGVENSWVLYNWQTKETIRPVHEQDSSRILDQGIKRDDGFSRLMAAVVNDTSVMYNTYAGSGFSKDSLKLNAQSPKPKTDTLANPAAVVIAKPPAAKSQLPTANSQPSTVNHQPSAPIAKTPARPLPNPGVKKLREVTLKISRKIVYLDIGKDGISDTVTLFVYFETDSTKKKPVPVPALVVNKQAKTDTADSGKSLVRLKNPDTSAVKKTVPRNKALDTSTLKTARSNNQDSAGLGKTAAKNKPTKSAEPVCSQQATEGDVAALRSAILKANAEQEKIAVASGAFALKCFSVSQIRLLASLFVSDKAKYRLMDAAHGHISDKDHFPELVDMLTDKNFQRKFLVLAEKRS